MADNFAQGLEGNTPLSDQSNQANQPDMESPEDSETNQAPSSEQDQNPQTSDNQPESQNFARQLEGNTIFSGNQPQQNQELQGFNPDAFIQENQAQTQAPQNFDPNAFIQQSQKNVASNKEWNLGSEALSLVGGPLATFAAQEAGLSTTKAFLEGAGQGVIGPLAPLAEEAMGIKRQDILAREQAHPFAHTAGEMGGLAAGAAASFGVGAGIEAAGAAAEGLTAVGQASQAVSELALASGATVEEASQAAKAATAGFSNYAKIGSSALKGAAEMAVMSGNDEASKLILKDPHTSAESAIANIGLGSVMGGATGAFVTGVASPLWEKFAGPRIKSGLEAVTDALGGRHSEIETPIEQDIKNSKVEPPQQLAPVLNGNSLARQLHLTAMQSDTNFASRAYQEEIESYKNTLSNEAIRTIGGNPQTVKAGAQLDQAAVGKDIGESWIAERRKELAPISAGFDEFESKTADSPIPLNTRTALNSRVAELIKQNKWDTPVFEDERKVANQVLEQTKYMTQVGDIKPVITKLKKLPFGSPGYDAAQQLAETLQNSQHEAIVSSIMKQGGSYEEGVQEVERYEGLRQQYGQFMNKISNMNSYLGAGKYYGPESFFSNLQDKIDTKPELVLKSFTNPNRAEMLNSLQEEAPETLKKIKQYHVDNIVQNAANLKTKTAAQGITDYINSMSPQMRQLLMSPEQEQKLTSIGRILQTLKDPRYNYSNTGRTVTSLLMRHSVMSPLALMVGAHEGGWKGALAGLAGELAVGELAPASSIALLKWMGSNQETDALGVKAAAQYVANSYKGQTALSGAISSLFKSGSLMAKSGLSATLAKNLISTPEDRQKVEDLAQKVKNQPEYLSSNLRGHLGAYMPDHQTALASAIATPLQYCNQIRPQATRQTPLSPKLPPAPADVARYQRCLGFAAKPLSILQYIQNGSLHASDVKDLENMYPSLTTHIRSKLMQAVTEAETNGQTIPYKTRMGISLFLGQPMDSTMMPQNIMAAQISKQSAPQMAQGNQNQKKPKTSEIGKTTSLYQTPIGASEARKANSK